MFGLEILKALLKYDTYLKYSSILLELDNKEKEFNKILQTISRYYSTYPDCKVIGLDDLQMYFHYLWPTVKDKALYDTLFTKLRELDLNNEKLIVDSLHKTVGKHYASLIGTEALAICADERDGFDEVRKYLTTLDTLTGRIADIESNVCKAGIHELLEHDMQDKLRWRLSELNNVIGPPTAGSLGHIFAFSEIGKSTFGISELTYFAQQLHKQNEEGVVLYLNNEEPIKRLKTRMYCALLGVSKEWLIANKATADELYIANGGERIVAVDKVDHINDVEYALERYKPVVCFVDQGPKVEFPVEKNATQPRILQQLYQRYRTVSKTYNTRMITLGQADAIAKTMQYLDLDRLDSSKVGIPGELDYAIGIGSKQGEDYEDVRYISVPKNKLTGDHAEFPCTFDKVRCRYK